MTIDHCRSEQLRCAEQYHDAGARLGMTYISFCSGIEAATAAWHPLGWSPVAFCEIDKFASRVLAHHYPNVPNLGDFTKVDWSQYSADICVGGTPCQAFSVAGLRNSLADERGNLTLEFVRAINIIRPHIIVWENVPGVLSTADNAFGCFLAALVGCDEPIVFEQGWPNAGVVDGPDRRAAWRILDAQYFGLAQRRKRVFVVANSGDRPHPAEILLEWESLRRDSAPSRTAGEGAAHPIAPSLTSSGRGVERGGDTRGQDPVVAMCLGAKGGVGRMDAESETFVTHALTASADQGATEDGTGRGCPLVAVAHSLSADGFDASEDGTGRGTPLVAVGWNGDTTPKSSLDVMPTMRRKQGGEGYGISAGMAVRRLTPEECEALQGFPPRLHQHSRRRRWPPLSKPRQLHGRASYGLDWSSDFGGVCKRLNSADLSSYAARLSTTMPVRGWD